MKEITTNNSGIISPSFLDNWCNEHPRLTTAGVVLVFLAPVAQKIYPDIKNGAKYVFDNWMAYRNRKLDMIGQPVCTDFVDLSESTDATDTTTA